MSKIGTKYVCEYIMDVDSKKLEKKGIKLTIEDKKVD